MTSLVTELFGSNYLVSKKKVIDILRRKNYLRRIINGVNKKPTDAKELVVWEEHCENC